MFGEGGGPVSMPVVEWDGLGGNLRPFAEYVGDGVAVLHGPGGAAALLDLVAGAPDGLGVERWQPPHRSALKRLVAGDVCIVLEMTRDSLCHFTKIHDGRRWRDGWRWLSFPWDVRVNEEK